MKNSIRKINKERNKVDGFILEKIDLLKDFLLKEKLKKVLTRMIVKKVFG